MYGISLITSPFIIFLVIYSLFMVMPSFVVSSWLLPPAFFRAILSSSVFSFTLAGTVAVMLMDKLLPCAEHINATKVATRVSWPQCSNERPYLPWNNNIIGIAFVLARTAAHRSMTGHSPKSSRCLCLCFLEQCHPGTHKAVASAPSRNPRRISLNLVCHFAVLLGSYVTSCIWAVPDLPIHIRREMSTSTTREPDDPEGVREPTATNATMPQGR